MNSQGLITIVAEVAKTMIFYVLFSQGAIWSLFNFNRFEFSSS